MCVRRIRVIIHLFPVLIEHRKTIKNIVQFACEISKNKLFNLKFVINFEHGFV